MGRARLIVNREVFLAHGLNELNFSTIQGLHRRFPMAWERREQFPFYKHMCLERLNFKKEYSLKLLYCLFEEATNDSVLFNALFDVLYKKYSLLYKELKKLCGRMEVLKDESLTKLREKYLVEENETDHLFIVAVIDFFMDKINARYDEQETFFKLQRRYKQQVEYYLCLNEENIVSQYAYLKRELNQSNSSLLKQLKKFYQSYSDYCGRPVIERLNEQIEQMYSSTNDSSVINWCHALGIIDKPLVYRLTMMDVYHLFALVLFTPDDGELKNEEEEIEVGAYLLPRVEFENFEFCLTEVLPYYIMSETLAINREFFFQSYTMVDLSISIALQREVERSKHEIKGLKEINKLLKTKLNQQKSAYEKEWRQKQKEMTVEMIKLDKEKKQLLKDLSSLQRKYDDLIQSNEGISNTKPEIEFVIEEEGMTIEKINTAEIMIVGGATPTIQKLKRVLPECKYFEVDKSYSSQFFKGVKVAILLTNILNHGMTNKLDKLCPEVRKTSITVTNVDLILKEINTFLLNK